MGNPYLSLRELTTEASVLDGTQVMIMAPDESGAIGMRVVDMQELRDNYLLVGVNESSGASEPPGEWCISTTCHDDAHRYCDGRSGLRWQ